MVEVERCRKTCDSQSGLVNDRMTYHCVSYRRLQWGKWTPLVAHNLCLPPDTKEQTCQRRVDSADELPPFIISIVCLAREQILGSCACHQTRGNKHTRGEWIVQLSCHLSLYQDSPPAKEINILLISQPQTFTKKSCKGSRSVATSSDSHWQKVSDVLRMFAKVCETTWTPSLT